MRFIAIVVAGGAGLRVGGETSKQWRPVAGKPMIRWSIEAFLAAGADLVVVVAPVNALNTARMLCEGLLRVKIVAGGAERIDSVRAGLMAIEGEDVEAVMVHDAARPFLTKAHVKSLLGALKGADGALPALAVSDTLKRAGVDRDVQDTPSRENLWRAQTPQAFRWPKLRDAYAIWPLDRTPTDDAQVMRVTQCL
jgi:2-C-methyl-D-erythritol 4-phosphate cytidylyltransferase/2-C-methyl-D-erythritol 2,4-cyclodiphosphate synthase